MYINDSISKYIYDLSSRQPTPGGGSVAGLCGTLGVALLEMVCNFTTGGEKYKDVETEICEYLVSLKKIREGFTALIDEDVKVYSAIRSAFKTKDKKVIDNALKEGYYISQKTCSLSVTAMQIAVELSEKGNVNLITDVGCGAELLKAAFNSGVFNSEINLKGMEDKGFVEKEKKVLDSFKKEIEVLYKDTIEVVTHKLKT